MIEIGDYVVYKPKLIWHKNPIIKGIRHVGSFVSAFPR